MKTDIQQPQCCHRTTVNDLCSFFTVCTLKNNKIRRPGFLIKGNIIPFPQGSQKPETCTAEYKRGIRSLSRYKNRSYMVSCMLCILLRFPGNRAWESPACLSNICIQGPHKLGRHCGDPNLQYYGVPNLDRHWVPLKMQSHERIDFQHREAQYQK